MVVSGVSGGRKASSTNRALDEGIEKKHRRSKGPIDPGKGSKDDVAEPSHRNETKTPLRSRI